jgi:hypothetical protein
MGRHTISTGAAAPPRRPRWSVHLRRTISLAVLTSLLLACAPPTTSAPATAAAKPAAPAATGAAPPAAAANPASAQARGSATIVFEAEPNTIVPKDSGTNNGYFVLDNVYDHLTARDWSSGQAKIVP